MKYKSMTLYNDFARSRLADISVLRFKVKVAVICSPIKKKSIRSHLASLSRFVSVQGDVILAALCVPAGQGMLRKPPMFFRR
jgi:hypothetical protein